MSILERFRQRKTRLGGTILVLLLAGWLNVLGQPCLMAAPLDDCDGSALHHQSMAQTDGAAYAPDLHQDYKVDHFLDCMSMVDCIDWIAADLAVTSPDPEFKFLVAMVSSNEEWPGQFVFHHAPIQRQSPPRQVPLFIENCALLI